MKSSIITLACLSLLVAIQEATAKPSTPIAGCLRKEVVPADGSVESCYDFALKHGTTFEKLLLWNTGLHKNCDNLDTDNEICVLGPAVAPKTTITPTKTPAAVPAAPAASMVSSAATRTANLPVKTIVQPKTSAPSNANVSQTAKVSKTTAAKAAKPTLAVHTTTTTGARTLYPNLAKTIAQKTGTVRPTTADPTVRTSAGTLNASLWAMA
ncbi:hypothetical protein BC939DRAFT_439252 [Gamsiella multidivaricata]|uniref:uncharacterized protein n=1 Tax=Gamsiella multidivaricata TaxID=101098 RepID=UPI0022210AB4|nr:uncharacterized protein BC939DRAFT_439252 [Gamsiella multidivaricata]KAG0371138.1 hypothetical protein BGZ54_010112 [Gamsiella multidivaricata]KAI7830412.1 hypothetical protein BC939DRAFT_439252 [Gamsiella multidivaricata]